MKILEHLPCRHFLEQLLCIVCVDAPLWLYVFMGSIRRGLERLRRFHMGWRGLETQEVLHRVPGAGQHWCHLPSLSRDLARCRRRHRGSQAVCGQQTAIGDCKRLTALEDGGIAKLIGAAKH